MHQGTITTLRPNRDDGRGFGVIAPDDGGPELFFTSASAEGALDAFRRKLRNFRHLGPAACKPFDELRRGQRVTFAIGEDARRAGRLCATHVRPIAA